MVAARRERGGSGSFIGGGRGDGVGEGEGGGRGDHGGAGVLAREIFPSSKTRGQAGWLSAAQVGRPEKLFLKKKIQTNKRDKNK